MEKKHSSGVILHLFFPHTSVSSLQCKNITDVIVRLCTLWFFPTCFITPVLEKF